MSMLNHIKILIKSEFFRGNLHNTNSNITPTRFAKPAQIPALRN